MIPAGKFKWKVTIKALVITRDAMGGTVESWTNVYANIPAFVEEFSGREKFHVESAREMSYNQKRVETRYIRGINKTHKILYDSELYDILRIETIGFREGSRFTIQLAE